MNRMIKLAERRPLLVVIGLIVAAFAAMAAVAAICAAALQTQIQDMTVQMLAQAAGAIFSIFIIWRLGWLRVLGPPVKGNGTVALLTAVILVYSSAAALLSFFGSIGLPGSAPAGSGPVLLHSALAGFMEELLFRGAVLLPLAFAWNSPRGRIAAALTSAALFAVVHMLNAIGGDPGMTMLQIAEAFLSAVLYAALVVRFGSIWPAILLHGLVNLLVNRYAVAAPAFVATASDYLVLVICDIPLAAVGLYLVWKQPGWWNSAPDGGEVLPPGSPARPPR